MREIYLQDLLHTGEAIRPPRSLAVTHFPFVIGRHSECDGQVPHPCVSRQQCQLFLQSGEIWIRDLGSRNGTFLNNERLNAPRPLRDRDLLEFSLSVFRVRLPAEPSGCALKHAADPEEPPVERRQRILVVDDNEDAAETLATVLRYRGHDVSVAHDGPEALVLAKASHPDTVLLDIRLPGMDGYQIAECLQGQQELGTMRLVGLTGYQDDDDALRSRKAGLLTLLTKPVDPTALEKVIADNG
jgi:CheY-like chemotaxis protein